jgi:ribosomal protein L11 methyltransferase
MKHKIFKYTIGNFNIKDAFEASDILFEKNYMAVSCAEKDKGWAVEILDENEITESEISDILQDYHFSCIEIDELKETNWLKKCFENFKPITVGDFYIYGPHLRSEPIPADKIAIEIAAATAFGTGEHPTTDRCLMACRIFFDEKYHKSVLDIGCGSCILSIALAKLGARNVDACDIDEEAVKVSRENIAVNGVAHQINVFRNEGCEFGRGKYDFITANILAEPLISMADAIVSSMSDKGTLVLSGFTSDDDSVVKKYLSLGSDLKFKYDFKGWTTAVFCGKAANFTL